jgi:hypothetical protein
VGEPTGASRVLTIIGPTLITLWLLVIGVLLIRKGRERRIDQMAATSEPAAGA